MSHKNDTRSRQSASGGGSRSGGATSGDSASGFLTTGTLPASKTCGLAPQVFFCLQADGGVLAGVDLRAAADRRLGHMEQLLSSCWLLASQYSADWILTRISARCGSSRPTREPGPHRRAPQFARLGAVVQQVSLAGHRQVEVVARLAEADADVGMMLQVMRERRLVRGEKPHIAFVVDLLERSSAGWSARFRRPPW
jgi:hypothetical protein